MITWVLLLLSISQAPFVQAAYCGTSTIPYSFEALPDGSFILGCARPFCFGYEPNTGNWATEDSRFNEVNGHPDGFLRSTDELQRAPFFPSNPQTSTCFTSGTCLRDQWAAGYDLNLAGTPLICCAYPLLTSSQDLGVAAVHPGEITVGGENQDTFDYIRNIRAVLTDNGAIEGYDVEMGRMPCGEPIPLQTVVEEAVPAGQQVAPQTYYQPGYTYWTGGYQDFRCFTADSMVTLSDGSSIRMDELLIGDWIKSPAPTMVEVMNSPVESWLHRIPEKETEFIVLKTAIGKEIKLTQDHFLYRAQCNVTGYQHAEMIRAGDVRVGDCLWEAIFNTNTFLPTKVTEITSSREKGIYAPLTDSGKIIVNGLMASCFSDVKNDVLVQSVRERLVNCDSTEGLESLQCNLKEIGISLLVEMTKLALPEEMS